MFEVGFTFDHVTQEKRWLNLNLYRNVKDVYPIGEWENTGVPSCGDTQVRHSVPDGGHSGAAQKGQEENVGARAHLDGEGQLLSSWLSKAN